MTSAAARVMRVPDVTPEQWTALRVLAVERGLSLGALVTTALQTAPATRKVFAK